MSHAKELFLDHAATTPVHPDVVGVMLPYFGNHFGIPTPHSEFGRRAKRAVDEARSRVAALINADVDEIVFTSGATESNNLAILGAASRGRHKGRHIITSAVEHPSVLRVCRHLENCGFSVSYVPVDCQGRIEALQVREAVRDDTILISIMHGNHAIGTIQPVEEIGAIAREKGIPLHCDAAQSIGKVAVDTKSLPVDLLSISSHKIYGPKGAGALFVRNITGIDPTFFGSGQEQGIRPGTVNVPCVAGFGLACSIAQRDMENNTMLVTSLRESFEQQVINRIKGARIIGSGAARLPHISSLSVEGVQGDALAAHLDAVNITVSSGRDRDSAGDEPWTVHTAIGLGQEYAQGAIRVGIGWENTEKEIRRMVDRLEEAVERNREFVRASREADVTVFTFPDRDHAQAALKALTDSGLAFSLVPRPLEIMHASCSTVSLACLSRDRAVVGALLGESGVTIAGMHQAHLPQRAVEKKERDFWAKVEQIKKKLS